MHIPAPEGRHYRRFQEDGIRFLIAHPCALLADDPGLGKTQQALGLLNALPHIRTTLIVCPATLKRTWATEAARWLIAHPGDATHLVTGATTPEALHHLLARAAPVPSARPDAIAPQVPRAMVIMNYEQLPKFCTLTTFPVFGKESIRVAQFMQGLTVDLVIMDECHAIRNRTTIRSVCARSIQATRKVMISGTPLYNRYQDLFACLNYLDPLTWQNIWAYEREYGSRAQLPLLHAKLHSTIMIRRTTEEALPELPEKIRQVIELPADGAAPQIQAELQAYTALQALRQDAKHAKRTADSAAYKEAVARLRAGRSAARAHLAQLRQATALAKLPQVIAHTKMCLESTPKAIVFCWHKRVLAELQTALASYHPVVIAGGTSLAQRKQAEDTFQTDPDCRILIGSLRVASEGITLTAATLVIFAELDWSPAVMAQCENRPWRMGQQAVVRVHQLVFEGSLDAHMAGTLLAKHEQIDAVMYGIRS